VRLRPLRRLAVPVAATAILVTAIAGLLLLGRGELSAPPITTLTSIDALRAWFDARSPAVAVFALMRLGCLGLAGYLLALVVLGLLAGVTRSSAVLRAADAATPPGLRRATAALFGVGLMGAASGPLVNDGGAATETLVVVDRLAPGEPTEVLVPLDEEPEATDGWATLSLRPPEKVVPATPATERWTVQRGDHLWSIAESHLGDVLGRPPTDAEIAPYWRRLIEHNRSRLHDPREPDLIFVGQVFELPPP
jgi:LysM domain